MPVRDTIQISGLGLSFHCARTLRGLIELLPSSPSWKSTIVTIPGYSTKTPLVLYYRDPLECVESILMNPLFSGKIDYCPRMEYDLNGKCCYNEWIASDGAWDSQVRYMSVTQTPQLMPTALRHDSHKDQPPLASSYRRIRRHSQQ